MQSRLAMLALSASLAACSHFGGHDGRSAAGGASAPPSADPRFMRDISHANLAEIAAGRLAVQEAQSPAVKEFGQQMVDDHSALQSEGRSLAEAKGMEPPTTPDLRHQAALAKLEAASGESFDRDYMEQMVQDHADTLQLLQEAASGAADPRVRQLAQEAIPHVRQHLEEARRIAGDIIGRAQ